MDLLKAETANTLNRIKSNLTFSQEANVNLKGDYDNL